MGLTRDLSTRVRQARIYFSNKVQLARKFIYQFGKPVNGVHVDQLLKGESLVPTVVCAFPRITTRQN
jgi:hypothetical protein